MITCPRCGTQNDDGSEFCKKCGASLHGAPETRAFSRPREECFGIPYGGAIVGIIFGTILILLGLGTVLGVDIERYVGPFILIVIGALIIVGAIYGYTRRSGR